MQGACRITDIDHVVEAVMDKHVNSAVYSLDQLEDVDAWARKESCIVLSMLS